MKKYKLEEFTKGWIVGNFNPSIIKTDKCEVAIKKYIAGENEDRHTHKKADEITIIVTGKYKMNGHEVKEGDVLHLVPGDDTDFICLEDGYTAVVKMPSVKNDKFLI